MKQALDHHIHNLLRWIGIGVGVVLFFALTTTGQTRIPSVFASPQSTPVPGAPLRGIHIGEAWS